MAQSGCAPSTGVPKFKMQREYAEFVGTVARVLMPAPPSVWSLAAAATVVHGLPSVLGIASAHGAVGTSIGVATSGPAGIGHGRTNEP